MSNHIANIDTNSILLMVSSFSRTESWYPLDFKCQLLAKLHESHMGVVKSKLLARTLVYWPNWDDDVEHVCNECETCRENQHMPPNIPKFQVNARGPGEVYGCDVTEIQGRQHIVVVDYFSCCIFKDNCQI